MLVTCLLTYLLTTDWFYLPGAGSPGWCWTKSKRAVKWLCVCVLLLKSRIYLSKALKRGLCNMPLDTDELITTADKRQFCLIFSKTHCLHHLLPSQRTALCPFSESVTTILPSHTRISICIKIPLLIIACSIFANTVII